MVKPRLLPCALALGIVVSVGYGQWLETRITIPDSLGGATGPACLTTDSSERYVYIGDASGAVYVADAEVGLRVGKVPTGSYIDAVCLNSVRNKVYCTNYDSSSVTVISCATNRAVATVPAGEGPAVLCYNSHDDKVYCGNHEGDDLTIIDGASDSVIKTMRVGQRPSALCYNPTSNSVFCVVSDTVAVLDGTSDTFAALIEVVVGGWGTRMCVNPVSNKVYVTGGGGVLALDGTTGSVLDTIPTGSVAGMSCNPATNRLYVGIGGLHDGEVLAIDGAADTLIERVDLGKFIHSVACDTAANRVYVARSDPSRRSYEVVSIDGVSHSIIARITAGCRYGELLGSSRLNRVYCTGRDGTELSVIDTGADSLLHTIKIGGGASLMCYNATDDKVYYVSVAVFGEAGAIDAATNRPVAHMPVGQLPVDVVWHVPNNRVYCANNLSGDVTVIDARVDTVVKTVPVCRNPRRIGSAPSVSKVYCAGNGELAVVDGRNDSVIKVIEIPTSLVDAMCFVSTASYDKLYVAGISAVCIVDCVGDTLIRSYPFGNALLTQDSDGKRVYCARPYSLCVFDPAGDTLVAEQAWDASGAEAMLYVPGVEKLYVACGAGIETFVLVVDAVACTLITQIRTPRPNSLGYDSMTGLVYCGRSYDDKVMFVDSSTDSIVDSLSPCVDPSAFTMVPAHRRVYVGNGGNSFIPVIRSEPPGLVELTRPASPRVSSDPTIVSSNSPLVASRPSVLLDAAGRKVGEVKPGQCVLTRYRAGVYFLRPCTGGAAAKLLLVP